ncbi:FAD/NAD(P)-binding domain-containing protein [Gonapodya prolifera JEL478]|uniref:FAD/NAD(P)-binding domain-containing protein n=1 Tax=Gonapodya prolifera (strain JEL478) TaxID=1344416 RepID=A0A138ZXI8_GONPJ|nr:FAD/NAD(P)-binding domain-containing protein [Gonapodya prolifera JEL478]|eukprot:KXS09015.1 FAD/NAD(P)-binding domain-containing protein [Gonapodya prolifera JEL478]
MSADHNPSPSNPLRVAIVGSGVAGLSTAWLLTLPENRAKFDVTVFENESWLGGHAHTVEVGGGAKFPVDVGFIVCNEVTYPNFLRVLGQLGVSYAPSNMSFSVSRDRGKLEWAGSSLGSVFAQPGSLFDARMWRMVWEVIRFDALADRIAREEEERELKESPYARTTLGEFFTREGFSHFFFENYVLPMTAAVWSTPPTVATSSFPLLTFLRFCRNHRLLQITDRPEWKTVAGGSRAYVSAIAKQIGAERCLTGASVTRVVRERGKSIGGVKVYFKGTNGVEQERVFDHVVFATHTDTTLEILGLDATPEEVDALGGVKFSKNQVVLHGDSNVSPGPCLYLMFRNLISGHGPPTQLMPRLPICRSSWNYITLSPHGAETKSGSLCLTYCMNVLQPWIDKAGIGDILVTVNPVFEPEKSKVWGTWEKTHPVVDADLLRAQRLLPTLQSLPSTNTNFIGAWTHHGFHEDGCTSGLLAGLSLGAKCPFPVELNGGFPTARRGWRRRGDPVDTTESSVGVGKGIWPGGKGRGEMEKEWLMWGLAGVVGVVGVAAGFLLSR